MVSLSTQLSIYQSLPRRSRNVIECTDRSQWQVFFPSQHAPVRAINALTWVVRALRAAGSYRTVSIEAFVVEGHPAFPLFLEQTWLRTQVHSQRRLDDRRQAREGQFRCPCGWCIGQARQSRRRREPRSERVKLGHERRERTTFVF